MISYTVIYTECPYVNVLAIISQLIEVTREFNKRKLHDL